MTLPAFLFDAACSAPLTRWFPWLAVALLSGCASGPEPVVQPARYVVAPAPVYPVASRRNQEQGTVTLRVQVRADESVGFVDIKAGSGFARLDAAAVDAAKRAKYAAAKTKSGKGVDSVLVVPVAFRLD
jgi:protein TonB